jgi:hypothetical protein
VLENTAAAVLAAGSALPTFILHENNDMVTKRISQSVSIQALHETRSCVLDADPCCRKQPRNSETGVRGVRSACGAPRLSPSRPPHDQPWGHLPPGEKAGWVVAQCFTTNISINVCQVTLSTHRLPAFQVLPRKTLERSDHVRQRNIVVRWCSLSSTLQLIAVSTGPHFKPPDGRKRGCGLISVVFRCCM